MGTTLTGDGYHLNHMFIYLMICLRFAQGQDCRPHRGARSGIRRRGPRFLRRQNANASLAGLNRALVAGLAHDLVQLSAHSAATTYIFVTAAN